MPAHPRLAATVLLTAALAACAPDTSPAPPAASGSTTPAPSTTVSPTSSASPSPTATASPAGTMRVAVYYLGETHRGPRLYREFRSVPRSTGVVRAAVDAMLHLAPLDPDYRSLWPRATTVRGVSVSGTTATVDLSGAARSASAGAEAERMSLQQLVHTVTAAAPTVKSVRLRIDGATPQTLWGHVDTRNPITRADSTMTLGPVWVVEPASGATVPRTFTASGVATVFEATVSWSVTYPCAPGTACRPPIKKGFVTASAGAPARGTWKVTVTLPSTVRGDVVFTAWESSAEDGRVTFADSKRYRVQ